MHALQHLSNCLYAAAPAVSSNCDGLAIIAASGEIGEARLVARQIRTWMNDGVPPTEIVVTLRDLEENDAKLREVFDEYAVPAMWPAQAIRSCGAIIALRRAWRLARNDFRFRELAALWRNSYFRPEFAADLPLRAEALLRQLGVPRGKTAYLDELLTTAEDRLPLPMEDETMTSQARAERSQLAKRCLGFYQWFFGLYDQMPEAAPPRAMVAALLKLADALGLGRSPMPGHDAAAWNIFWSTLETRANSTKRKSVTFAEFETVLDDVTAKTLWPKPETVGVRVLPADTAVSVSCTHLVLMGLGEGSFPRFSGPATEEALASERSLFASLVRVPSKALVLSYAALDSKGQAMLPATFLREVSSYFGAIPTTTQTMLIDGYLRWPAISAAEVRTQAAAANQESANLKAARRMADARFNTGSTRYSGVLEHPPVKAAIADAFGPEKMFSPTALETYIACPFKFLLQKALRLQLLEEPSEEVEMSQRGTAIHRALSRFHEAKPHERPDSIASELDDHWSRAVGEHIERTPSSAGRVLWELERRRMNRSLNHYPKQWSDFQGGWTKKGSTPTPRHFEAMFGYDNKPQSKPVLTITVDGIEIRIGGVIDRVDLAKLDDGWGFWILDYKTGRGTSYTARELIDYERLQLPLYALAIERLFHDGDPLRPLGMAYWILLDDGPKRMLPGKRQEFDWLANPGQWHNYRDELERVVARVAAQLRSADFRLAPRNQHTCNYCDYKTICRINQQRGRLMPLALTNELKSPERE